MLEAQHHSERTEQGGMAFKHQITAQVHSAHTGEGRRLGVHRPLLTGIYRPEKLQMTPAKSCYRGTGDWLFIVMPAKYLKWYLCMFESLGQITCQL